MKPVTTPRCLAGDTEWMVGPVSDLSLCLCLSSTSGSKQRCLSLHHVQSLTLDKYVHYLPRSSLYFMTYDFCLFPGFKYCLVTIIF